MADSHASQAAEAESKYVYFILAASAAALGYAVEHAEQPGLTLQYVLFLVASLSWLLSFYLGLRATQQRLSSLNLLANAEQLEQALNMARRNLSNDNVRPFGEQFHAAVNRTNQNLDHHSANFDSYVSWQFRLIALGVIAYVGWRMFPLLPLI